MPRDIAHTPTKNLVDRLLDYDYNRIPTALGVNVDRRKGGDLPIFPIEYARLRTCKPFVALCILIVGVDGLCRSDP